MMMQDPLLDSYPSPPLQLQAGDPTVGRQCTRSGVRRAAAAIVPVGTNVAAVRISAPGWEYAILDGLQVCLRHQRLVPCCCHFQYCNGLPL